MKSVGEILRKKREELDMPLEQIEFETGISLKKLSLLETNKFDQIDNHFYNKAYIKLYAEAVNLNPEHLIALYKRDFENIQHKRIVNKDEKEILKKKKDAFIIKILNFLITPKKVGLFISLIVITLFSLIAYSSVKKAFNQPYLKLISPIELEGNYSGKIEYAGEEIIFKGETEAGTLVKFNEEPVVIKPGFKFESDPIGLSQEENEVVIEASNQLGRKTLMKIILVQRNPEIRELELIIKPQEDNVDLTIKADGIVRFEGKTKVQDSIRITAERTLEIFSNNPSSLQTFINSREYKLQKQVEVFENNKTEVVQK